MPVVPQSMEVHTGTMMMTRMHATKKAAKAATPIREANNPLPLRSRRQVHDLKPKLCRHEELCTSVGGTAGALREGSGSSSSLNGCCGSLPDGPPVSLSLFGGSQNFTMLVQMPSPDVIS